MFQNRTQEEKDGEIVYWEIDDFKTNLTELKQLGFEKYLPYNTPKTALIKALKVISKGNDRFYKRFADRAGQVRFAVVNPAVYENQDRDVDIDFNKEIVINLEKNSGYLTCTNQGSSDPEFFNTIMRQYLMERGTIDTTQFRALIRKFIRNACLGVPMRRRGGMYFVDVRHQRTLNRIHGLFEHFRQHATLYRIPLNLGDAKTASAVHDALSHDFESEIGELIAWFDGDNITNRSLKNRVKDVEGLKERIEFHSVNLAEKAETLKNQLEKVAGVIEQVQQGQGPQTFAEMLAAV